MYDYASFIPRYSPLLAQSHSFLRILRDFPSTVSHGVHNVRFYDGFDMPLHAGRDIFRGIRQEGHILLEQKPQQPFSTITMLIENVPDSNTSSESATLTILSASKTISTLKLPIAQAVPAQIKANQLTFLQNTGRIDLFVSYTATPSAPHVVYIKEMHLDNQKVNLGTLDYPDVSSLGYQTTPISYLYYGGKVKDAWKLWDVRARINERTFDFWWIKNLYYWDRPQQVIWAMLLADIVICVTALLFVGRQIKTELHT